MNISHFFSVDKMPPPSRFPCFRRTWAPHRGALFDHQLGALRGHGTPVIQVMDDHDLVVKHTDTYGYLYIPMDTYSFFLDHPWDPPWLKPPQVNPLTPSNFHRSQISVKRLGCWRRAKAMKLSLGGCISFEVLMIGTPQKRRSLVNPNPKTLAILGILDLFWGSVSSIFETTIIY